MKTTTHNTSHPPPNFTGFPTHHILDVTMILLQQNKRKARAKGEKCHDRTVHSKPIKISNDHTPCADKQAVVKFICIRIKKKTKAEGKKCHAKTMWSKKKSIYVE